MAQVVKEQLETTLPGLTVNLTVEPKKQRVQDMQDGNFQLGLTRWGPDYADPMTYLGMWVTGNSNNYGLWSDAEFDSIIEECTTGDLCTDPEGRWAALYDAEAIVLEQAVIFPLYGQCNAEMISSALCNYQGFKKCVLILVFDAYRVPGSPGSIEQYHNIHVVYTREAETADMFIERVTHEIGKGRRVRVATSDGMEQVIILGHGALRVSARMFHEEVQEAEKEIRRYLQGTD